MSLSLNSGLRKRCPVADGLMQAKCQGPSDRLADSQAPQVAQARLGSARLGQSQSQSQSARRWLRFEGQDTTAGRARRRRLKCVEPSLRRRAGKAGKGGEEEEEEEEEEGGRKLLFSPSSGGAVLSGRRKRTDSGPLSLSRDGATPRASERRPTTDSARKLSKEGASLSLRV